MIYDEYITRNEPIACKHCGDRLLTNARGFRKSPHIDRYIQRRMRGVFDLLIADEVHELAAAESIQGNTFGTLASGMSVHPGTDRHADRRSSAGPSRAAVAK